MQEIQGKTAKQISDKIRELKKEGELEEVGAMSGGDDLL